MRRSDLALVVLVGGLAITVAWLGSHRRPGLDAPPRPKAATPAPQVVQASAPAPADAGPPMTMKGDMGVATVRSTTPAPQRDLTQIRSLIAETPGTYMGDMLEDLGGHLSRWPDRREDGLRIWVQSAAPVPDFDDRYTQMARDAFDDWGRDSELPIRFDFVLDSAACDIRILWAAQFPASSGQRVGITRRTTDQHGWMLHADIEVAIHDSTGRTIPPGSLVGIVRHEAGHALGMGHSKDQRTKMFPTELMSEITSADRSTLRLLYRLPPGLAR
jgi:matrixin